MPSTHLSLHFHIVFSTKDRHPFIADDWRGRLHEYLGGLVRAADGLNWDLLNDGLGNSKNTKSHLYSTETPPSMATGIRASAMVAIQAGYKFIEFQQHSDQDMQNVHDYMASLRPEPSPNLNHRSLTTSALRGKALFQDSTVGCANCHSGPYLTDLHQQNVGTGHPGILVSMTPFTIRRLCMNSGAPPPICRTVRHPRLEMFSPRKTATICTASRPSSIPAS